MNAPKTFASRPHSSPQPWSREAQQVQQPAPSTVTTSSSAATTSTAKVRPPALDSEAADLDQIKPTRKRRVVAKLDATRLLSPEGLVHLKTKGPLLKLYGQGHEAADLAKLMQFYQLWAHRLFPKLAFPEFIAQAEKVCTQKRLRVHLDEWRKPAPEPEPEFLLHSPTTDDITPSHGITLDQSNIHDNDTPNELWNNTTAANEPSTQTNLDQTTVDRIEMNRQRALERLAENQRRLEQIALQDENFDVFSDEENP
ncbi:chromosome segregation in meiosis- protein [Dispira parvispora]|uniref:Chromosome segregation in meiosis protein n=1 Tax=Dispira parvispora TaxID=1520584 RepID=A0A9W8E4E6_9FUNG|nr:chromosome segregation in meiosis- protein [Dispira parvispora]